MTAAEGTERRAGSHRGAYRVYELSESRARAAREAADAAARIDGRRRWVWGELGARGGTAVVGGEPPDGADRPPAGLDAAYGPLCALYQQCAEGLIRGGVDALVVEASRDPLRIGAALTGARRAMEWIGFELPLLLHMPRWPG